VPVKKDLHRLQKTDEKRKLILSNRRRDGPAQGPQKTREKRSLGKYFKAMWAKRLGGQGSKKKKSLKAQAKAGVLMTNKGESLPEGRRGEVATRLGSSGKTHKPIARQPKEISTIEL